MTYSAYKLEVLKLKINEHFPSAKNQNLKHSIFTKAEKTSALQEASLFIPFHFLVILKSIIH